MMVLLLTRKLLYEVRLVLLLCLGMATVLFALGGYLYRTFGDLTVENMMRLPPQLVAGMFGGLTARADPLAIWFIVLYTHPLMLTLFAAAVISIASRSLAGEIDRGTVDLLLSTPVSRAQMVVGTLLSLQIATVALTLAVAGGSRLGLMLAGLDGPADPVQFRWVQLNLWALFAAFSGVATLISALSSERGRAITGAISFLVLSFFVNLIASLWAAVRWTDVLSIFHYYQPRVAVLDGQVPMSQLAVLLALAVISAAARACCGCRPNRTDGNN